MILRALILILAVIVQAGASAQPAVTRAKKVTVASPGDAPGPWGAIIRYSILSDFADNRNPRSYTNSVLGTLTYSFSPRFSAEMVAGARAETIGGQIPKGREQAYEETLGPSTSFGLNFEDNLFRTHKYGLYIQGEPLWDEASRREGYRGLVGVGTNVSLRFFKRAYIMTHDFSASELINTYPYGSNLSANPDYFLTYRLSNVVKLYRGLRGTYSFGMKVTRYMDDFIGYSYSNSVALSYVWPHVTVSLAYDNGGFTDKGEISMWYLDQYRRLARLVVGYTF